MTVFSTIYLVIINVCLCVVIGKMTYLTFVYWKKFSTASKCVDVMLVICAGIVFVFNVVWMTYN